MRVSKISLSICGRIPRRTSGFTNATLAGEMLIRSLLTSWSTTAGGTNSSVQPNSNGSLLQI